MCQFQSKASSRQFPPVRELFLFQAPTPRLEKFNKYMEHQRSSVNADFAPRFADAHTASLGGLRVRRQAQPPVLSPPCSSGPPAALSLPELWPFPSQRPSPAPLSGRISGPHHHQAPGPPSPPSSHSPSLPAPAPGNGLDPGSQRPDP